MNYRVVFSPEAGEQLASLYRYLAEAASPAVAARYTGAIVDCCESLCTFPWRGTARDDVRPGLRMIHYKKRTLIAFDIEAGTVSIVGVFHSAQDYATILQDSADDMDDDFAEC